VNNLDFHKSTFNIAASILPDEVYNTVFPPNLTGEEGGGEGGRGGANTRVNTAIWQLKLNVALKFSHTNVSRLGWYPIVYTHTKLHNTVYYRSGLIL